jgi:hypothetical protein
LNRLVTLKFQTDYAALLANAILYQSFQDDVKTTLAAAMAVPSANVSAQYL